VKFDGTSLVSSSTLTQDSTGRVKNSAQPIVSAFRSANVGSVTGDGTGYVILFDTILLNVGSSYSGGTGIFNASVAGNYLVCGAVCNSNIGAANTAGIILIEFTGRSFSAGAMNYTVCKDVNNNIVNSFSVISPMAVSDQLFIGSVVSGGTKTVGVNGSGNPLTYLGIYLLC
jgi:hypothetical protein